MNGRNGTDESDVPRIVKTVRLAPAGRSLLLVAGMPGAGKSTLLAGLPARPDVVVLDSDTRRTALQALFGCYRPVVHAWHRLALVVAAFSAAQTVVVHLPATSAGARAAVAASPSDRPRGAPAVAARDPANARACQQAAGGWWARRRSRATPSAR